MLAHAIRRALGPDVPLSFLACPEGHRHWQHFSEQASCQVKGETQQQDTARAACYTFSRYLAELDRVVGTPRPPPLYASS